MTLATRTTAKMAGKKVKNEIETIRGDLRQLTEAVWALRDQVQSEFALSAASRTGSTSKLHAQVASLERKTSEEVSSGNLSSFGFYASPEDTAAVRWSLDALPIAELVDGVPLTAASTLAAVGHPQRLAILSAILQKPASAGELVESLSLGTTGAAYHHLNVLQAAGFVSQLQRGIFRFQPEKIPVFLTLLAALSDATQVEIEPQPAP
jgi:DNA-binding transcriptional ArsR family regulator